MTRPDHETKYGFAWENAHVVRLISHRGYRVLAVVTPRQYHEIRVTPTGLIRSTTRKATANDQRIGDS